MPSAPYWKLRRLAPRAKRVQQRRGAESAALGAYGDTVPGKADAFMTAYDAATKYESTWRKEMAEGRGAVGALLRKMRGWVPLLVRDVPGFDGGDFGDRADVPDDVIGDGERLEDMAEKVTDAEGKHPSRATQGPAARCSRAPRVRGGYQSRTRRLLSSALSAEDGQR